MIRPVQKALYAVIGNPAAHSMSPVMMNAVFEVLSIPAVYLALQVDDPADDLVTLSKLGVQGISVTIPHKESAYRLSVSADEPSHTMGAVNTLRLHGAQWEGRNTDWIGAISALRSHIEQFAGKRALIIGAGGVARAALYGLKRERAAITISNRGIERGEALARAFDCDFVPLSQLQQTNCGRDFDIIVQCTPIGLINTSEEDSGLIPETLFHPGIVVLDTVYRPFWTPFLLKAGAAGSVTIPGVEMLLHQGIAQLEWWFGELIQPEVVLPVMKKALMGAFEDE
jgi:shikimate dehydrogenase